MPAGGVRSFQDAAPSSLKNTLLLPKACRRPGAVGLWRMMPLSCRLMPAFASVQVTPLSAVLKMPPRLTAQNVPAVSGDATRPETAPPSGPLEVHRPAPATLAFDSDSASKRHENTGRGRRRNDLVLDCIDAGIR